MNEFTVPDRLPADRFTPERIPVRDFPHAPGTVVQDGPGGPVFVVTDRDGRAFLACCEEHEEAGRASGFHPAQDNGRMLILDLVQIPHDTVRSCKAAPADEEA